MDIKVYILITEIHLYIKKEKLYTNISEFERNSSLEKFQLLTNKSTPIIKFLDH